MTLRAAYDDGTVRVFHAEHAALAEHLRETGERPASLVSDPPYSARTHDGHDDGTASANRVADWAARTKAAGRTPVIHDTPSGFARRAADLGHERRSLGYAAWTDADVAAFVGAWSPLVVGWFVSLTDHTLVPSWAAAYEAAGRYAFAPLACIEVAGRIRLQGDGPPQWACFAAASRPSSREWIAAWQESRRAKGEPCSLKGAHVFGRDPDVGERWVGGKPVAMIRALVRDYSRPGDLIVDPCCGAGTLGVAVRYEGRRAILADKDPAAVECTIKRLRGERTKPTRDDFPETDTQPSLFAREAAE